MAAKKKTKKRRESATISGLTITPPPPPLGGFTSGKAIVATVVTIASAIIGVAIAAGLPLSRDTTDHILTLITVTTPAVVGVIGWWHHNHIKIAVIREKEVSS